MPWEVRKSDACPAERPWGVFKEGETADPLGCHESEEAAREQQKALYANEPEVKSLGLKFVAKDTIEGLAIPFSRDLEGDTFTKDTDLCLEWFGRSGRPVLYHHGLEEPGVKKIGSQIEYEERPDGYWAQAQLEQHHRYRKAVDRLIDEGALGFSSGTFPHLAQRKSGRITQWPWVELSLTPIPAHPGTFVGHTIKSATFLEYLEGDETKLTLAAVKAIAAGLDPDATPAPESMDDKAGRVSAAVAEFREHARAAHAMRLGQKSGRVLSKANRERIARVLASRDAVIEAYADLQALFDESDPEARQQAEDKAREAKALYAEYLRIESRINGVPV